jgi:uncharacterized protein (DUF433 family)
MSQSLNYRDSITIEPGKRSGKPCICGMRITVYDVLDCLVGGMSIEEVLDVPTLPARTLWLVWPMPQTRKRPSW